MWILSKDSGLPFLPLSNLLPAEERAHYTHVSRMVLILSLVLGCALCAHAGQKELIDTSETVGVRFGREYTRRWEVGVITSAVGGPCKDIFATVPVPTEWPEQDVRIVNEDVSPAVRRVSHRMLQGGVKQMLVQIPNLRKGQTAQALITFEVTRRNIVAPKDTSAFVMPKKIPRAIRRYLSASPYIESRHGKIRSIAREVTKDKELAWTKAECIYDYVRENVEYREGKIKGALASLRDGTGDCEELTSLFVAICRAAKIPSRMVWIPDHCYPEFYLTDNEGNGHWIPCQVAGTRNFGGMVEARPVLQKGDNFNVPEKKGQPQRYVSEFLRGSKFRGSGKPKVEFVRKLLPAKDF